MFYTVSYLLSIFIIIMITLEFLRALVIMSKVKRMNITKQGQKIEKLLRKEEFSTFERYSDELEQKYALTGSPIILHWNIRFFLIQACTASL